MRRWGEATVVVGEVIDGHESIYISGDGSIDNSGDVFESFGGLGESGFGVVGGAGGGIGKTGDEVIEIG
ncbi:hypothetical protein AGMMS49592_1180 [Endomicrobiia bacterium]|nr:hypothetical protein AGMMS49592_1180 [Endomicrobiia bacterium]